MFWQNLHRQLLCPTCISFPDLTSERLLITAAFSTAGGRSQQFLFPCRYFKTTQTEVWGKKYTHTEDTSKRTQTRTKIPQNGKSRLNARRGQRLPHADLSAGRLSSAGERWGPGTAAPVPDPSQNQAGWRHAASDPPQNSAHSVFTWGPLRPKLPQQVPDQSLKMSPFWTPEDPPGRRPLQRKCLSPERSVGPVTHTHRALHSG